MNPINIHSKTIHSKYAKTTVNIRSSPSTKSKICGQFYWNDNISVIEKESNNWYEIVYRGKTRYVASEYLRGNKYKSKVYHLSNKNTFKSYEDGDCITNNTSLLHGKLKQKYHMDYKTGVWMVGDRYCVALGQFYTKKVGTKVDLILLNNNKTHTLKCIAADVKAKKDTINKHRIHKDGSIAEFVVKTKLLSSKTKLTGDVSYAGNQFKGTIVKIKVYKEDK